MKNNVRVVIVLLLVAALLNIPSKFVEAQTVGNSKEFAVNLKDLTYQNNDKLVGFSLVRLLNILQNKYNITFLYRSNVLRNKFINNRKALLYSVNGIKFKHLLSHLSLTYSRLDSLTYVIYPQKKRHPISKVQKIYKVKGKVTDSKSGSPLPGVNVYIKGTTNGTSTNSNGKYSLSGVSSRDTLVYSYIGYVSQFIPFMGQRTINVKLKSQTIIGKEMVVVGYGEQKKQNLTGAVSSIQTKQVTQLPSATVSGSLVGKIAGVNTRQASGIPGGNTTINIRNFGNPLFVIDGVPESQGDFDELNPNSIKSISVLKGASAAIYGSRAANGVILVTTKSGNYNQKNQVNIDSYYGWQTWDRFPQMATAAQYIKASIEANMNQFGSTNFSPATLKKWEQGTQLGYIPFNWYNFATAKDVPQYHVSANVSGGTKLTKYYLSFGRVNQEGVFRQYDYHRSNVEASITTKAFKNFEVGIHIKGRIEARPHPGAPGFNDYFAPTHGIYNQHPIYWPYANYNTRYPQTTNQTTSDDALIRKSITGSYRSTWRVLTTNLHAKYSFPVKGLTLKGVYSYYYSENYENDFEYTYNTYGYDPTTKTYNITGGNQNPYRDRVTNLFQDQLFQTQLNYNHTFHKTKLSGMLAFEMHTQKNPGYYIHSIPSSNYISLITTNEFQNINDWFYHSGRDAFIWRLNYNKNSTYIIDFSGRYDASSAFPPHKRWGWFPSISAGWRISNEAFFQKSFLANVFSNLKIRASYGILGDDNIGISPYAYYQGYNFGYGNYVFDNSIYTGIQPTGLPTRNVTWIKAHTTDIGIDFGLFNNKLTGSVDYFYRKRTGLLAPKYNVLVPVSAGISLPDQNLNSDANIGADGSITYKNSVNSDFRYSIGINATFSRQKILHVYKPRFANSWDQYRNGVTNRWAGIQWGYQVIGRFKSQKQIDNYPVNEDGKGNTTLLPGDLIYKDVNHDGVINSLDMRPIAYQNGNFANGLPFLNFGLNAGLHYKNLSFSVEFAGAAFGSFLRQYELLVPFQDSGNSPAYIFNAWHHQNIFNNASPWVPGYYPPLRKSMSGSHDLQTSTFDLVNVHYIRLKNLKIGYTLPFEWIKHDFHVKRLMVYLDGYDLFSLDNLKKFGVDPEVNQSNGIQYPQTRIVNVGFNMSF